MSAFKTRINGATNKNTMFELSCPYCGHRNIMTADDWFGDGVTICDNTDGGCDRKFAYEYEVSWMSQEYKLTHDGYRK